MTPEAALERQIERYRAMTGEDRLRIALDLHALSVARSNGSPRGDHRKALPFRAFALS